MRIGTLAHQLGTTPHAIRFYEQRGLLPAPRRGSNRYREYTEADAERLRLLIGLRQLDIALDQAAELATMCAAGRCDEVTAELRTLRFLDQRMADLAGQLEAGAAPRTLINLGKEKEHAPTL